MYWDISRPLSYNCLFNFILGARGVGKSYGAKRWAIRDFLKTGKQFVYVRRYKEELKKIDKFFDDVSHEFEEHEFKVNKPNFYIDGEIAGTAMALSVSKIEKSTPFPNVNKIIFDEFIIDKGAIRYLPDEVTNFLELYSTVGRDRDPTALFLSNALSTYNPYFVYFDLSLPYKTDIVAKNDILIQMVHDNEYEEHMKSTRFGKIIEGTDYANYAINNQFLRDNSNFIQKKTVNAKHEFAMIYKGETVGIWVDYKEGYAYASLDTDPACKLVYAITHDDHTPNTMILQGRRSMFIEQFITYYKYGLLRYENQKVKNICREIIKLTF